MSNNDKYKYRTWLASCLIAISVLIVTCNTLFESKPMRMVICTSLSIISVVLTIKYLDSKQFNDLKKTIVLIVGVWIWSVVLAVIQGTEKPLKLESLEFLIYTGLLTFLFCNTKLSTVPLKTALYLIIAFFYYQYFIVGITSYGINDSDSGAVNTLILLALSITIQVIDYRDNQCIAMLPSALIVPISIMSWNRTGFFVSVLYLLTVFFLGSSMSKRKSTRWLLTLILMVVVAVVVVKFFDWFTQSALYSKFEDRGVDNTSRLTIWASYFSSFDMIQLLFGRGIDNRHTLISGFVNPHNSFIMLHSQIGLLSFVLIFIMFKRLAQYYKYNKFIFLLFFVLIIRCMFDMIFFFEPFDYAFYIFLFNSDCLVVKHDSVSIKII